jgi:pyridoxal phosphate enzyme (YggS family)
LDFDSGPDPEAVAFFGAARSRIFGIVADACARSGRDPHEVTLVAVSKTVDASRLRDAVAAGFDVLGENRVQEAEAKAPAVAGARWHLIGPLQSNKARRAVELFDAIESVDSVDLARRLDRLAGELGRAPFGVYLQVNVDRDPAKAGFLPEALEAELAVLGGLSNLRRLGLMTVGRLTGSAREARMTFVRLRELSERLRGGETAASGGGGAPSAGLGAGLSMGMTADYPIAVEEGATVIRVGRAIFGAR